MASELNRNFNLAKATNSFRRHGFAKEHQLRILKFGPEPFNTRLQRARYYVTSASIPQLSRESLDVPFQGTNIKTVGQLNYGNESSIGFRTAGDFLGRNELEQWMTEVGMNPLTGDGKYCVGEDSTIQYVILDDKGRITRGYEFFDVFPTNLGEIAFNSEGNAPTNFDFTFAFSYWCPMDISVLDLDAFADEGGDDSTSTSTNKSLIFDQYEQRIAEKETTTDTDC